MNKDNTLDKTLRDILWDNISPIPKNDHETVAFIEKLDEITDEIAKAESSGICCAECGMDVDIGEYHPYGVCLMFKACKDAKTVRANLWDIQERSYNMGRIAGEALKISQANDPNPPLEDVMVCVQCGNPLYEANVELCSVCNWKLNKL